MNDPHHTLLDVLGVLSARRSGEAMLEAQVTPEALPDACRLLRDQGHARLLTMLGQDARASHGAFRLHCLFCLPPDGQVCTLSADVSPQAPAYWSITPGLPGAAWHEREIQDLLGLVPLGHPDPRPLIRHAGWPHDYLPLRKDAASHRPPPGDVPLIGEAGQNPPYPWERSERPSPVPTAADGGLVFGPLSEGIGEPAQLRVEMRGDVIDALECDLFYTHRGAEKLCEGRFPNQALEIVERICGACSFANALACCRAFEAGMGREVPPRAHVLRALFLELERLQGLAGDIAALSAAAGLPDVEDRCTALRESLLSLNLDLIGTRLIRNVTTVGGMRRDLPAGAHATMSRALRKGIALWQEAEARVLGDGALRRRLRDLGTLGTEAAEAMGVVGTAARAAALPRDSRIEMPADAYRALPPHMGLRTEGDAEARMLVRLDGIADSFRLIAALTDSLPGGPIALSGDEPRVGTQGVGVAESARGENVCWVAVGSGGLVERLHLRAASQTIWPALSPIAGGTPIQDLPLLLASFGLCVACVDR
jgi:Ni,Fe-hydrogenase III large subunit/Ni,Fe-hydrogenase III component G